MEKIIIHRYILLQSNYFTCNILFCRFYEGEGRNFREFEKTRFFFGVMICRLAEIGNFAGTNFCFRKSFCPVKARGGVTIIYAGTGCAIFGGAFFRAENEFWGIIFGKITSSHEFWGVILEK